MANLYGESVYNKYRIDIGLWIWCLLDEINVKICVRLQVTCLSGTVPNVLISNIV